MKGTYSEKQRHLKSHLKLLLLAPCLLSSVIADTSAAASSGSGTSATAPTTSMCPVLSCDVRNTKLADGTCFALVGSGPITQISGQMCYDEDTAKPSDIPDVCPFTPRDS